MPLVLTFLSGLFFLVGIIIYKKVENKTKFSNISIACAAIVLLGLIGFDLIPEILEKENISFFVFTIIGLGALIFIDKLIPHHNHEHHENDEEEKEHQEHLVHINTITLIALLLHNMIEGMGLYSVTLNDLKNGVIMLLGIGLHNLPFGFQIASLNKNKQNIVLLLLLVLSGFLGGILFSINGTMNEFVETAILSLTLGMLLQILIFELLKEVWQNRKRKETIYGIIIGILIVVIINLI